MKVLILEFFSPYIFLNNKHNICPYLTNKNCLLARGFTLWLFGRPFMGFGKSLIVDLTSNDSLVRGRSLSVH